MRHKKILDVFTRILKGRQKVIFRLEGLEQPVFLEPGNVKQCTGLEITEVELLIGSSMRIECYEHGEIMLNGEVHISGESLIIKDFWIELEDTLENLKVKNASRLLSFKEIKKVFHFNRNDTDTVGFDVWEEKAVFISANLLLGLTKLSLSEVHILEGSYIAPVYFEVGEIVNVDTDKEPILCRKSGVLLKEINLRLFGKTEEMHERFESDNTPPWSDNHEHVYHNDTRDNSRSWLSDAAGSRDRDVMNDVYWNLD